MIVMQPVERTGIQRELRGDATGATSPVLPSFDVSVAAAFAPILRADPARPFVVAQLGQSLDGRIATTTGESRYINGTGALDHLHALRAHVDAVVVGIGTVLADDPQLTVRRVPGRSPVRVILDPNGKLPDHARCFDEAGPLCLVVRSSDRPTPDGVESLLLPADGDGQIEPRDIVDALFVRGLRRLLIEGGADTISRFIDARCVDRLHVLVAPVIIGSGKPSLDLAPIGDLTKALRPPVGIYVLPSGDVLFDCDLKAPV
jgi:diaminohydroxyphosphoribosylaminopyrimidine deaminase/5-amino-6-(5-phosphoribosylamino)uracil reductase